MIGNAKELIKDARMNHYALAGINATTYEGIQAVLRAAEKIGMPVMLSFAQVHEPFAPIETFGKLMYEMAEKAKVPVILHLDHGVDYSYLIKAVRVGFNSIMYDCSRFPYEENVSKVKNFTQLAHKLGIIVESEVGVMPGNIKGQTGYGEASSDDFDISQYFTKPDMAKRFVEETGTDLLTVSFGTVHGFFVKKPVLSISLVNEIKKIVDCGLVMHGTTGVDEQQIIAAKDAGICKFNYFTGVGTAASNDMVNYIKQSDSPVYYHEVAQLATEIMQKKAEHMIELLGNGVKNS